MPIDRKKYHPQWEKISRFVRLIRARWHCEACGVRNYAVGRWEEGKWVPLRGNATADELGRGHCSYRQARNYVAAYNADAADAGVAKLSVVILTTAHLDHDTANNDLENLKALCQNCHLKHDRKDNAEKRKYGKTGRFYNQIRLHF
ncbi:hypothetical protein F5984_20585 [Rudanella paleaurantiibacter]|uniref:HNH endonuclease n=1 Tax=Rudanella paleaurantiibacter TaxID=2614655 RepID=A0A7J5TVH3_9BACT|nr:hypothetical protein [Rudanella paleaurantiibacter]KAB7728145.1 hypothetical protein F5984_20585 [Rudanella paleaurantiibacter]